MTHKTEVSRTLTGWFIWVCACGDQAPNAFRIKLYAQFHARKHEQKVRG